MSHPTVAFDLGRSRIVADLKTPLGLTLYRYGLTNPELALVRLLLHAGDCFVDAGANIGLFTLVAAASVGPSGRVLAFEPAAAGADSTRRNARLNGFTWVEVKQVALADRRGRQAFYVFEGSASGFSSFAPEDPLLAEVATADLATLDESLSPYVRDHVRFVKIDVEGAEMRVLQGAKKLLASVGPDLLIELEPGHLGRQGVSVAQILDFLAQFGYRSYSIKQTVTGHICATSCDWREARDNPNAYLTRHPDKMHAAGLRTH